MNEKLLSALVGLARTAEGNEHKLNSVTFDVISASLLAEDGDEETVNSFYFRVREEKKRLVPDCFYCAAPCGRNEDYDASNLEINSEDIRELKFQLLDRARDIAQKCDESDIHLLCRLLYAVGRDDWSREELREILDNA